VTGKARVEYFFDPSLVLEESNNALTPFKTPSKKDGMDPEIISSKHLFLPCTIVKSLAENDEEGNKDGTSGPVLVKTADGALHKITDSSQLMSLTTPDDYIGMNDVLHLANISEASLLHTLRLRYKRDDIYTSAGPILISINPYKTIVVNGESLYSDNLMMKYRNSEDSSSHEDPHLFQVADRAYNAMMDSIHNVPHLEEADADLMVNEDHPDLKGWARNQSIIISGESGAGKTEATKYIMQYLARITMKRSNRPTDSVFTSPDGKVMAALEDRVLSSNPLLETFGNAQTLRNDNSSRFGKFIHINFNTSTGSIVGARISNYLLEKTRITAQIEGERNYHIFYQLFAGASTDLQEELGLDGGAESFSYLGNRPAAKNQKDADAFQETIACLSRIGIVGDKQKAVFALAAAVLHIGNITFEDKVGDSGDHTADITEASHPSLQKACELLGLKEAEVSEAILTKLLTIGGKTIKKQSTVAMASDKRDAFAKMTYSGLFLWLVQSINETLSESTSQLESSKPSLVTAGAKQGFIGVLDIYGFECFEVNGFEQLLINYCNEKLQRHFNRHLFEVEQNLYASEGVDWTYITFNDNRPCLELIEGGLGTIGILNTLDDAWGGMGTSAEKDVKFVSQLHKLFGGKAGVPAARGGNKKKKKKTSGEGGYKGHDYFITPKFGMDRQYIIVHYAGEVSALSVGGIRMTSIASLLR
jgi:myosin heavy subunit